MVNSKFIADILDLLLDGDEAGLAVRNQIPYIVENEVEYTGSGFICTFKHLDGISKYKYEGDDTMFHGIEISSPEYICSGSSGWMDLFTSNGYLDYLQFIGHCDNYPMADLKSYTMKQMWQGSPGRVITVSDK